MRVSPSPDERHAIFAYVQSQHLLFLSQVACWSLTSRSEASSLKTVRAPHQARECLLLCMPHYSGTTSSDAMWLLCS